MVKKQKVFEDKLKNFTNSKYAFVLLMALQVYI